MSTLGPGLCEETMNNPVIFTLRVGISPSQGFSRLTSFSGWVLWALAGGTHPCKGRGRGVVLNGQLLHSGF